jgi:hypothetical protein
VLQVERFFAPNIKRLPKRHASLEYLIEGQSSGKENYFNESRCVFPCFAFRVLSDGGLLSKLVYD